MHKSENPKYRRKNLFSPAEHSAGSSVKKNGRMNNIAKICIINKARVKQTSLLACLFILPLPGKALAVYADYLALTDVKALSAN